MSSYDPQIEEAKRDMEAAEDELVQLGEISEKSWMLIKGYLHNAIQHNALLYFKGIEESVASPPTEKEWASSTPQFQTQVKS